MAKCSGKNEEILPKRYQNNRNLIRISDHIETSLLPWQRLSWLIEQNSRIPNFSNNTIISIVKLLSTIFVGTSLL